MSYRRCVFAYLFLCLTVAALVGQSASGTDVAASPGKGPAWTNVVLKRVAPEYPYTERVKYHQGSGIYEGTIDVKTGLVTSVTVKKSTGYPGLDDAVVKALQQWRFKPGTIKAVRLPMTFEMTRDEAEAMKRLRRYQTQQP